MQFDLVSQTKNDLQDFSQTKVKIAGVDVKDAPYLTRQRKGYSFSQAETIRFIDLYYNSKFESGDLDQEGQRKLFLNVCAFRADVATKQIDIDTKDFVFLPDEGTAKWPAQLMSKEFHAWAKENYFGDLLNEVVELWPRYGTVVIKTSNNNLEVVPLQTLHNQQDAKDLQTARYVILEHTDMGYEDIVDMPWDIEPLKLQFGDKITVYERYGRVPLDYYKRHKGQQVDNGDEFKTVDTMSIVTFSAREKMQGKQGHVLFLEKITKRPFLEVHYKRQHGRWLGIGEVESLFENQIAANMIANMERRALMWASKKIFQSPDDGIAKNLVKDVKDGDVLTISPNGNVTQVDMANRSMADYKATAQSWEDNANQKTFTFEIVTGESMPSGTPFRLGVMLSNTIQSHYGLKREKLGLFMKRVVNDFLYSKFKRDHTLRHAVNVFMDDEGYDLIKRMMVSTEYNRIMVSGLLQGKLLNPLAVKQAIDDYVAKQQMLAINLPDNFYDKVKASITLTVTGEEVNLEKKIETLSNVLQVLGPDHPAYQVILGKIVSLTGENIDFALQQPVPSQLPGEPAQEGQAPIGRNLSAKASKIPSPVKAEQIKL